MAARMFAERAFGASDQLEMSPRLGRVVPEFGIETLRELILGSYRIIYRLIEDHEIVEILALHHGARLLKLELFENDAD